LLSCSAGTGKHIEDGSEELDNAAMHKHERGSKSDRQTEDGQTIVKADSSGLVSHETLDEAFHRRPSLATRQAPD
jgi:hypothetical protein